MEDFAKFKCWIKIGWEEKYKNEIYTHKHKNILVMLCNKITLFYILFLYYNKITFNNQWE